MLSLPNASAVVVQVAVSALLSATLVHPEIAAPFDVKETVPVGNIAPVDGETAAVRITVWPKTEGAAEEVTTVVEEAWLTVCVRVPELLL